VENKYNTDKTIGMLSNYEILFDSIKNKPVKYLEIGVYYGGSLLWASDYFSHAESKIYGVDKYLGNADYISAEKITLLEANQNDSDKLQELGKKYGCFDVVIDDGSHMTKETINSFEILWKYVKPGGWYIIEDWGVCYTPYVTPENISMDKVVADILLNVKKLNISAAQIILGGEKGTYALFRKGLK